MRIAVTGRGGQVANALLEKAAGMPDVALLAFVRASVDLTRPESILPALKSVRPSVVVNAAAYTAVDQAESEPGTAMSVNGAGAGAVAAAARTLGIPVIQLSTDYVFDGAKASPYVEADPVGPINAYGRSKLAGEEAVAAANPDHVILRTSWVYAAEGKNFLRTMLRLAEERDEVRVVADQIGAPGYAPDIAAAILSIARNLLDAPADAALRGVFHGTGGGEASWADFAEAIFARLARNGRKVPRLARIATADYPTPARRPANSRLDCTRLKAIHGIALPDWQDALDRCFLRLAEG